MVLDRAVDRTAERVTFGSVCSGIEAASVAWASLGWRATFLSEIAAFPSAVLAHHYPDVPNLGDLHGFARWPRTDLDVLVGGTPCQSFSVAGLRQGLADPRGNLTLVYLAVADRYRPRWIFWENVPGVLSDDEGRTFGAFLGGLAELGYGFAYRIFNAQHFGVPQRRRRVFVVGCARGWASAAAVLFESESLRGHPASGDATWEGNTGTLTASLGRGSADEVERDTLIPLIAPTLLGGGNRTGGPRPPGSTVDNAEALIPFYTTQVTHPENRSNPQPGDPSPTLAPTAHAPAIAFNIYPAGGQGADLEARATDVAMACTTIDAKQHDRGRRILSGAVTAKWRKQSGGPAGDECYNLVGGAAVRRLTPRECERLQGFPDDYTAIEYKGKPAADGPRYEAIGNSMAVPVMRWIGRRMELVDAVAAELEA